MGRMAVYVDEERLKKPLSEYLDVAGKRDGIKKIIAVTRMIEAAIRNDALNLFAEENRKKAEEERRKKLEIEREIDESWEAPTRRAK